MILIPIQKDQGLITTTISIKGTPIWDYTYYEDQFFYNSSELQNPKTHSLGFPHDLKKIRHRWDFIVVNPTDQKIVIQIEMIWEQIQNESTVKLNEWILEAIELPPNQPKAFTGTAYIIKN